MAVSESLLNGAIASGVFLFRDFFLGFTWRCDESPLQKKVDQLAKKMGVEIPIRAYENDSWAWYAHGCSLYGKAAITVPSLESGEKFKNDQATAILAHEISHIKHNDAVWFGLIVTVATVAFTYLGLLFVAAFVPFIVKELIVNGCILYVIHLRSVSQENRADDEALRYLNADQKRAFIRFFEGIRDANLGLRKYAEENPGLLNSIVLFMINSKGESLKGRFSHPTLESRIAKIRRSLEEETSKSGSWLPWKWSASAAGG